MIWRAAAADLPRIVDLGADFHAYSPWSHIPYDREAFAGFAERLITGGIIFLSSEGMIGGVLNPFYFNPRVVVAAELFWWAPSEGSALRAAFELWAKAQGAHLLQFSGLADERSHATARLFRQAGYRPVETGFVKEL